MQELHQARCSSCLGISLISTVNVDHHGKAVSTKLAQCSMCKKNKTSFFCTGCMRYFCVNKDRMNALVDAGCSMAEDAKKTIGTFESTNASTGEKVTYQYMCSCYQIAHEGAWEAHSKAINEQADANGFTAVSLVGAMQNASKACNSNNS